jgi:hypothetical protein
MAVLKQMLKHPKVLDEYREDKAENTPPPLDHEQLSEIEAVAPPDWDDLIDKLKKLPVAQRAPTRTKN